MPVVTAGVMVRTGKMLPPSPLLRRVFSPYLGRAVSAANLDAMMNQRKESQGTRG
jgi:hypothetical protein